MVKISEFEIKNGDITTKVIFLIPAVLKESKYLLEMNKVEAAIKDALLLIIRKYQAFPSQVNQCKKIKVIFKNKKHGAETEDYNIRTDSLTIRFGLDIVKYNSQDIFSLVLHELMHTIAHIHENQEYLQKQFEKYQKRALIEIEKDGGIYKKLVTQLKRYFGIGDLPRIEYMAEFFYMLTISPFHNVMADMALSIIAIKLQSSDYFATISSEVKTELITIEKGLAELDTFYNTELKNKKDNSQIDFLKSIIAITQYLYGTHDFFYELLPYALLPNPNQLAAKLFAEHVRLIKLYTFPELQPKMFKYTDYIEVVAIEQSKLFNPKDPNLKREIHNLDSVRAAKRAYGLFRRDAHNLLKDAETKYKKLK